MTAACQHITPPPPLLWCPLPAIFCLQLLLPPGYLAGVYAVMRAAGVVCVADEVQTGFGRTGRMWGFEHQGVVPDIVTLGKPMGEWCEVANLCMHAQLGSQAEGEGADEWMVCA